MMSEQKISSFQDFWPYYLAEHRLPSNRLLHYIGTALSLALLIYLLINQQWLYIPLCFVIGYGFAWAGHFLVEKNKPATFKYPVWSLLADYKMFGMALTCQLKKEWPKYF